MSCASGWIGGEARLCTDQPRGKSPLVDLSLNIRSSMRSNAQSPQIAEASSFPFSIIRIRTNNFFSLLTKNQVVILWLQKTFGNKQIVEAEQSFKLNFLSLFFKVDLLANGGGLLVLGSELFSNSISFRICHTNLRGYIYTSRIQVKSSSR